MTPRWIDPDDFLRVRTAKYLEDCDSIITILKSQGEVELTNLHLPETRCWLPGIIEALLKRALVDPQRNKFTGTIYEPPLSASVFKNKPSARGSILYIGWLRKEGETRGFFEADDANLVFIAVLKCEWEFYRPAWMGDDIRRGGWLIKRFLRGTKWIYNPLMMVDKETKRVKREERWVRLERGLFRKSLSHVIKQGYKNLDKKPHPQSAKGCPVYPMPNNRTDFEKIDPLHQKWFRSYMSAEKLKFCEWCGRIFQAKRSDARACSRSYCKKALSRRGTVRTYVYKKR